MRMKAQPGDCHERTNTHLVILAGRQDRYKITTLKMPWQEAVSQGWRQNLQRLPITLSIRRSGINQIAATNTYNAHDTTGRMKANGMAMT